MSDAARHEESPLPLFDRAQTLRVQPRPVVLRLVLRLVLRSTFVVVTTATACALPFFGELMVGRWWDFLIVFLCCLSCSFSKHHIGLTATRTEERCAALFASQGGGTQLDTGKRVGAPRQRTPAHFSAVPSCCGVTPFPCPPVLVQGLIASIGLMPITFILPPLLWVTARRPQGAELAVNLGIAGGASMLAVLAFVGSTRNIMQDAQAYLFG